MYSTASLKLLAEMHAVSPFRDDEAAILNLCLRAEAIDTCSGHDALQDHCSVQPIPLLTQVYTTTWKALLISRRLSV